MAGNGQPGRQIAWDSPPVFGEAASMALVHAPPVPDNQPALVRIAAYLHAIALTLVQPCLMCLWSLCLLFSKHF